MWRLAPLIGLALFLAGCQTARMKTPLVRADALDPHAETIVSGDGTRITGYLYRPEGPGPFAAVVMMHGCAGMLDKYGDLKLRDAMWLKILRDEGYAVLLLDSFTDRGYRSICRIRKRPIHPYRERPHDAYAALQWLQAQPFIRPDRVALAGWSNGAMSMLWTVRQGAPQRPKTLVHDFRAAIGFYPGCIRIRREVKDYRAALPVLLQVGLDDNWTLPRVCMKLVAEADARGGAKMEIDGYAGAYHGFDHPNSRVRQITTRNSALKGGRRTVWIGSNPAARARAIARVTAYLRRALSP